VHLGLSRANDRVDDEVFLGSVDFKMDPVVIGVSLGLLIGSRFDLPIALRVLVKDVSAFVVLDLPDHNPILTFPGNFLTDLGLDGEKFRVDLGILGKVAGFCWVGATLQGFYVTSQGGGLLTQCEVEGQCQIAKEDKSKCFHDKEDLGLISSKLLGIHILQKSFRTKLMNFCPKSPVKLPSGPDCRMNPS